MQVDNLYEKAPVGELVGIILDGGEQADEVMYYLLHQRFFLPLRKRFEIFQSQLLDDFDDVVDDFQLYLRDGKDDDDGELYPSLRRIRNVEAFGGWLPNTFRNYLSVRAAKESALIYSDLVADNAASTDIPSSILTDEEKLSCAADLIAYACQEMSSRDRFIFLRTLLTMLDKRQSLPNDAVAEALGMTDISYRVTVHRIKGALVKYRTRLLQGENLLLDDLHQEMSRNINDDFIHLYPTLLRYYNQSIDALNTAAAIRKLREEFRAATGLEAYEPEIPYVATSGIKAFWNKLTLFLLS